MSIYSSIAALMASVLLLIVGNGLINSLVPIRATLEGFPPVTVGVIGSIYFLGMLAGTFAAPMVLRRTGHVRAFCAFVSLAIAATLVMPVTVAPLPWIVLRGIIGFAFAGLYGVIDGWIAAKSANENRGQIYGAYQIVNFAGSAIGQQLLVVAAPGSFMLFSLVAGLFALATLPLAFTRSVEPELPNISYFDIRWMARKSPVGVAAALIVGATNGAFWSLSPVYALGTGLGANGVAIFLSAAVIGSAVAVWPIGRLSDIVDRRKVVIGVTALATLVEIGLFSIGMPSLTSLPIWGVLIGATTMVLYTLAVAHTNDRTGASYAVPVSSGLLFLYCVGAIISPTVGSVVMKQFGPQWLFAINAVMHGGLCMFTLWRVLRREKAHPVARPDTLASSSGPGLP